MIGICKALLAASVVSIMALAGQTLVLAAETTSAAVVLKPIAGPGGDDGRQVLLSVVVGTKQAVGYFLNEGGLCKVTVMVAEAFNGEDAPKASTVRFEVAIDDGGMAQVDTAEGKSLEFACLRNAQEMRVRSGNVPGGYPTGT